ncbi:hypothetical protein B0A48_18220 [Cryoendolithus antarcticus]|uniref:Transcription factor domain-containing protein n=1 Tax=Cryoendolithus antarcticus TaxID=1507870 RepID=A0A1V8S9T6_9PEZI|nr:hypothetical protein B0A48_18220 [Cryoendolithus antarcticus]
MLASQQIHDKQNEPRTEIEATVPQQGQHYGDMPKKRKLEPASDGPIEPAWKIDLFDSSSASAQVLATADLFKAVMSPILLHAIILAAAHGILSIEDFDAVALSFIGTISTEVLSGGKKSIELLQALQVASLWYCAPRTHQSIATLFQFLNVAQVMALDLGCGGDLDPPGEFVPPELAVGHTVPAKRGWLVCFVLGASSLFHRRRPGDQRWTTHHSECLHALETSPDAREGDRLLALHIRGERLGLNILQRLALSESIPSATIGEPLTSLTIQDLEREVHEWRALIPSDLDHPNLQTVAFAAEILIHEAVLHTGTNKQSFAVPYLPHRLFIGGYPTPKVTSEHVYSLQALKQACHNTIEAACSVSKEDFLALPYFLFAPRIAYAAFILAKIHIAVTAPGNTLGVIMSPSEVQLDYYLAKIVTFNERTRYDGSPGAATRVLEGCPMLSAWLVQYEQQLATSSDTISPTYDSSTMDDMPTEAVLAMVSPNESKLVVSDVTLPDLSWNWDAFLDFGPCAGDFDLTEFFAFGDVGGATGKVNAG